MKNIKTTFAILAFVFAIATTSTITFAQGIGARCPDGTRSINGRCGGEVTQSKYRYYLGGNGSWIAVGDQEAKILFLSTDGGKTFRQFYQTGFGGNAFEFTASYENPDMDGFVIELEYTNKGDVFTLGGREYNRATSSVLASGKFIPLPKKAEPFGLFSIGDGQYIYVARLDKYSPSRDFGLYYGPLNRMIRVASTRTLMPKGGSYSYIIESHMGNLKVKVAGLAGLTAVWDDENVDSLEIASFEFVEQNDRTVKVTRK